MCFDVTSFTKELFFIVYEMSTASMLIRMRDIVVDRQNSRDLKHPLSFTKLHKLSSGGEYVKNLDEVIDLGYVPVSPMEGY